MKTKRGRLHVEPFQPLNRPLRNHRRFGSGNDYRGTFARVSWWIFCANLLGKLCPRKKGNGCQFFLVVFVTKCESFRWIMGCWCPLMAVGLVEVFLWTLLGLFRKSCKTRLIWDAWRCFVLKAHWVFACIVLRIGEEPLKTAAILFHDFRWKSYGTRDDWWWYFCKAGKLPALQ